MSCVTPRHTCPMRALGLRPEASVHASTAACQGWGSERRPFHPEAKLPRRVRGALWEGVSAGERPQEARGSRWLAPPGEIAKPPPPLGVTPKTKLTK